MQKSTKIKIIISAVSAFLLFNLIGPCVYLITLFNSYQTKNHFYMGTAVRPDDCIIGVVFIIAAAIMLIVLNLVLWLYNKIFKD